MSEYNIEKERWTNHDDDFFRHRDSHACGYLDGSVITAGAISVLTMIMPMWKSLMLILGTIIMTTI